MNARLGYVLAFLAAAAVVGGAGAAEQSAQLRAEVGAGDTHTTRLGDLPRGASLSVQIKTSAPVGVLLLDHDGYRAFPDVGEALFDARAEERLRFAVRAPATGDYYLVVDNRAGTATPAFTLAVTASTGTAELPANVEAKLERLHAELDRFESNLRRLLVFDELDFRIGRCGSANVYAGADDTVYICAEVAQKLINGTDSREQARDVLLFAMLHEIGHVVLRQWDYPFYDNEEVADEFATVLLVMLGQGERARSLVDYFAGLPPEEELALKRDRDDRHPLSVQRARTINGWLDDPDLVRRWQKVLVPHLQTEILEALVQSPRAWTAPELVREELARRQE